MYKRVLQLMLTLTCAFALSPTAKIAVLPFSTLNSEFAICAGVEEFLRSELINTGCFDVIEQKRMKDIFREQQFQISGCTETTCVVEAGRVLSAEYIVSGTIDTVKRADYILPSGTVNYGMKSNIYISIVVHDIKMKAIVLKAIRSYSDFNQLEQKIVELGRVISEHLTVSNSAEIFQEKNRYDTFCNTLKNDKYNAQKEKNLINRMLPDEFYNKYYIQRIKNDSIFARNEFLSERRSYFSAHIGYGVIPYIVVDTNTSTAAVKNGSTETVFYGPQLYSLYNEDTWTHYYFGGIDDIRLIDDDISSLSIGFRLGFGCALSGIAGFSVIGGVVKTIREIGVRANCRFALNIATTPDNTFNILFACGYIGQLMEKNVVKTSSSHDVYTELSLSWRIIDDFILSTDIGLVYDWINYNPVQPGLYFNVPGLSYSGWKIYINLRPLFMQSPFLFGLIHF